MVPIIHPMAGVGSTLMEPTLTVIGEDRGFIGPILISPHGRFHLDLQLRLLHQASRRGSEAGKYRWLEGFYKLKKTRSHEKHC